MLEARASGDATDNDGRYRHHYYLTPTEGAGVTFKEPTVGELARVIKAGACIEASFKRGKSEAGMDEYQVRTWEGAYSTRKLPLIPRQACHRFHANPAADSRRKLPAIPRQSCHRFHANPAADSMAKLPPQRGFWRPS
jgi:hypothetical protein